MSRVAYWILAPFLVISAIALPPLIPQWTTGATIGVIGLEVFIVGLLVGLYDVRRFEWALRIVGGLVFACCAAYLIAEIVAGNWHWSRRPGRQSVLNALGAMFIFGLPCFWLALRGLRGFRSIVPLLFATSNPHKIEEVAAILRPRKIGIVGLDSLDAAPPEPVEDGETFEANARLKAIYYARATGMMCLADDSGLEVDALGGAPGIHSARFAREEIGADVFDSMSRDQRDRANNDKLLRLLRNVPHEKRTARFVCAMCLASPDGEILAETRGEFPGLIIDEPRGTNGFGYDPLLLVSERGLTSAELSPAEKNERSHRGAATRAMAERISGIEFAR